MADLFWHTAGDGRSHAYTGRGESKCGTWILIGVGMPLDATEEPGKRYCKTCLNAVRREKRWARESKKGRRCG